MNVRELTAEQAEQLGKTLRAWDRWTEFFLVNQCKDDAEADAFEETRALQELLQPPKQYLVQYADDERIAYVRDINSLRLAMDSDRTVWEWDNGTVGAPITGEPLKELLEGES